MRQWQVFDLRTLDAALACAVQFVVVGPLAVAPMAVLEAAHLAQPEAYTEPVLVRRFCSGLKITGMLVCMQGLIGLYR